MTPWGWLLLGLLVVGALTVVLSWTAGRLDRMHIRLATAQASLDRQLVDRVACVRGVATSGVLDPASALVSIDAAEAAHAAVGQADRAGAESTLSAVLRTILGDHAAYAELWQACDEAQRELLTDLGDACDRVRLAHRFQHDLVDRTAAMRRRVLVRALHLAGHAPWPTGLTFDDEPPAALTRR
ncbi:MAG: hypothetical protein ACRDO8_05920 [Nocardioidaceae bacterium]